MITVVAITDLLGSSCLALWDCALVEEVAALSGVVSPSAPGSPAAVRGSRLAASESWQVAL